MDYVCLCTRVRHLATNRGLPWHWSGGRALRRTRESHFRRVGGAYYQRQSSVYVHTNQKLFELFYTTQGEGRQAKVVRAAAGAKGFTPQQQQQQPQVSMQAQQQPAQGISEHMPDSLPDQVMTDEVKDCD